MSGVEFHTIHTPTTHQHYSSFSLLVSKNKYLSNVVINAIILAQQLMVSEMKCRTSFVVIFSAVFTWTKTFSATQD